MEVTQIPSGLTGGGLGVKYSDADHIASYKKLHELHEPWSGYFKYAPTIPFVGRDFFSRRPRILSYSSAENLTYTVTDKPHDIDELKVSSGDEIWNRHRYFRECYSGEPHFFPYVHLGPIQAGQQLLMLKFLLEKFLPGKYSDTPSSFIEQIAFGNFGKFAIQNGSINKDYSSNFERLSDSIPYVKEDLRRLEPNIVFLPRSILRTLTRNCSDLLASFPRCRFIELPQPFATNINCHLRKKVPLSKVLELSPVLVDWKSAVKGIDADTLLKYLDDQVSISI